MSDSNTSMERGQGLSGGQARQAPPPPSFAHPRPTIESLDLTGDTDSEHEIEYRSPAGSRAIKAHPHPLLTAKERTPLIPLKPANIQPIASGSSNGGGGSAKERIGASVMQGYHNLGIPFSVPVNPPYKHPVLAAPHPPPKKHNDDDDSDEDDDVFDEAAADRELRNLAGVEMGDEKEAEKALMKLIAGTMDIGEIDMTEGPPEGLDDRYKPHAHQMMGLHWLVHREVGPKPKPEDEKRKRKPKKAKGGGGILADDMGLGKTLQMILLILANKQSLKKSTDGVRPPKTTLIIAPMALMNQWESEIEKFTDGGLKVLCHYGPSRTDRSRKLEKYDVIITTYGVVESEWTDPNPRKKKGKAVAEGSDDDDDDEIAVIKPKKHSALFDAEFYRIILDEAHTIKNRLGKTHKACCALKGFHRWALTGTPIQNNIVDLFALFDFLGNIVKPLNHWPTFKEKIERHIKNKPKVAMSRLIVVLKSIMLRRTKTMMINGEPLIVLPKRDIIEVKGPFLDAEEQAFYKAVETKMQLAVNAFIKAGALNSNYTSVLTLLLRMRQACSHPSLVTGHSIDDVEALEPVVQKAGGEDDIDALIGGLDSLAVAEKVCVLCSSRVSAGSSYCETCAGEMKGFGNLQSSTKVKRSMRILEEIRTNEKGKKTIVFSQFTSMFDVLEPFLKSAKFKYVRFDGKLNAKQRDVALDKIRNDPTVTIILISIKCGSVGLNLTCCSRVILLDLWWNPAIENQAFDRAHRMGQIDDVKIYKITVDDTIEDRILTLQKEKAELAKAALEGGELGKSAKLTQQDILFLFRGDGGRH